MVEIDRADDGPFHMINLIEFREKADYRDGRETDLTGREADASYAPLEFLKQIGIVRYPSRALFFQMTQDEAFQSRSHGALPVP